MRYECRGCGRIFESNTPRKYCSAECKNEHNKKVFRLGTFKHKCPECGEVFFGTDIARFCGPECRKKSIDRDKKKPLSTLGEKLEYCKKMGITYAQYQMMHTTNNKSD